ncbi:hypothetical protein [Thalassotalea sp. PS06]|uniref:hypothetical protein n=1 Tax=Thalassotalea sp. PS06 TaxID=2594005 RepID=UPI0011625989|nr:hypothetical protein [Thalassotalea sp. PS06]QDP00453.1 hypothetical protein FNC98_03250 [Thalassotalea sp. PS06]
MKNKVRNVLAWLPAALVMTSIAMSAKASEKGDEQTLEPVVDNSCGIISVYRQPPEAKNIYPVNINKIDNFVVPDKSAQFQLSPGTHKIKLIELISDSYFTRRRGDMKNFKDFEIVIEPNKKYYLGAKYVRKNRSKLKTGEYWEPIVWKTTDMDCSMKS